MPIRFQVDADFYDHPKTLDASDAAVALWTRAGSYSAAKLLDGFVPDGALARLSRTPAEASGELVQRGLWKRVRGGYRFHQWDHRNLTRARVEAEREYEREKKRRQRVGQVSGTAVPAGQQGGHGRDSPGSPNRSVSVSLSESVSMSVSGHDPPPPANGRVPEPPPRCAEHLNAPTREPCRACGYARQALEAWRAEKRLRLDSAPRCRIHRGQLAHNCSGCRADALAAEGAK